MERVWLGASLVLGLIACNTNAEEIRSQKTDPSAQFDIFLPPLDTDYPDLSTDTDTDGTDTDTDVTDTEVTGDTDTDPDTDVTGDTDTDTDTDVTGDTDTDVPVP